MTTAPPSAETRRKEEEKADSVRQKVKELNCENSQIEGQRSAISERRKQDIPCKSFPRERWGGYVLRCKTDSKTKTKNRQRTL